MVTCIEEKGTGAVLADGPSTIKSIIPREKKIVYREDELTFHLREGPIYSGMCNLDPGSCNIQWRDL